MDVSTVSLRVLRAVAERGSFTAAADELGYTQSAVSRQVAVLERTTGRILFERRPDGVRLTRDGAALLRHAVVVLDELRRAETELDTTRTAVADVRVGFYLSAAASMLPALVTALRAHHPSIQVLSRDGTTPSLVRAVRTAALDVAIVTSRPPFAAPDDQLPRLPTHTLREDELRVAVASAGRFAGRNEVDVAELVEVEWIAGSGARGEPVLGVWPDLAGRPRVTHAVGDWLTKLRLVAIDAGVTTVPTTLVPLLPPGVHAMRVHGGTPVRRRVSLVRAPGRPSPAVQAVLDTLVELREAM